ncbi:MAG: flagellar hook-basal body protein [Armatimonadota bacterium]
MLRGLQSVVAGMTDRMEQQNVIANNLANINTPGYKRKTTSFANFETELRNAAETAKQPSHPLPKLVVGQDGGQGPIQVTGSQTNLALDGSGYFVVRGTSGEQLVRGGNFRLDGSGQLVNGDGLPVLGERGTICVSGDWRVTEEGDVESDGAVIDRLRIAPDPTVPSAQPARVVAASLEGSNVNSVEEMVSMISALRSYEACQKTVQSLDQTLDKLINQMSR